MTKTTHSERFWKLIVDAISAAEMASSVDHQPSLLFPYIQTVGSGLEVYLKSHAIPNCRRKTNLYDLINLLGGFGVSAKSIISFHKFRCDYYNKSKHEISFLPATNDVLNSLREIKMATDELISLNLGISGESISLISKRLFWIGFWDNYISGDTEVSIALPITTEWLPVTIDIIYIDMSSWDDVKENIHRVGDFKIGKESMPAKMYDAWAREGDFLEAGAFEGSYQALIEFLARRERVENLIAYLKRENNPNSMLTAVLFAAVDAAQNLRLTSNIVSEISNIIQDVAQNNYAAPVRSKIVKDYAFLIAESISAINYNKRFLLDGPTWITQENFNRELFLGAKKINNLNCAITIDLRVLIGSMM